jgi:hypothetical protein
MILALSPQWAWTVRSRPRHSQHERPVPAHCPRALHRNVSSNTDSTGGIRRRDPSHWNERRIPECGLAKRAGLQTLSAYGLWICEVLPTRPGNHYPSTGLDQYGVNVSFTVHAARVLGITVSDFDGTGRQWRRHKIRATALFNMPVG